MTLGDASPRSSDQHIPHGSWVDPHHFTEILISEPSGGVEVSDGAYLLCGQCPHPSLGNGVLGVVPFSADEKVCGVDALGPIAGVADEQTSGDGAVPMGVRPPVCSYVFLRTTWNLLEMEPAVALIELSGPIPAPSKRVLLDLREEPSFVVIPRPPRWVGRGPVMANPLVVLGAHPLDDPAISATSDDATRAIHGCHFTGSWN